MAKVTLEELPGEPDLVRASFPCQDLSLAGSGAGLAGKRSGTFKPFWKLIRAMHKSGRGPKIIALENVYGAITSNGGRDFATLAAAFSGLGYRFGRFEHSSALDAKSLRKQKTAPKGGLVTHLLYKRYFGSGGRDRT